MRLLKSSRRAAMIAQLLIAYAPACGLDTAPASSEVSRVRDAMVDAEFVECSQASSSDGCGRSDAGSAAAGCPDEAGRYCGRHGVEGDPDTLYACTNGVVSKVEVCAAGCERVGFGIADRCALAANGEDVADAGDGDAATWIAPPSTPPSSGPSAAAASSPPPSAAPSSGPAEQTQAPSAAASSAPPSAAPSSAPSEQTPASDAGVCPSGDGHYCGGHGVAGGADTLYQCTSNGLSAVKTCEYGCQPIEPGGADYCKETLSGCPQGDGSYCGGHGIPGDVDTLYFCMTGVLSAPMVCEHGCRALLQGGADFCGLIDPPPPLPPPPPAMPPPMPPPMP